MYIIHIVLVFAPLPNPPCVARVSSSLGGATSVNFSLTSLQLRFGLKKATSLIPGWGSCLNYLAILLSILST